MPGQQAFGAIQPPDQCVTALALFCRAFSMTAGSQEVRAMLALALKVRAYRIQAWHTS